LRTCIHNRLPLTRRRGFALLGSGDTMLRGAMTNLLLHRGLLSGLEPAFAVAFQTIGPALASRRRLAGPRQALLFLGSGRSGWAGSEIEPVCKRMRRRWWRCRETCEKGKSSKAKSQMTGHGIPGVLRPRLHDLWPRPGSQCG